MKQSENTLNAFICLLKFIHLKLRASFRVCAQSGSHIQIKIELLHRIIDSFVQTSE